MQGQTNNDDYWTQKRSKIGTWTVRIIYDDEKLEQVVSEILGW
jgi:hypothetical protein